MTRLTILSLGMLACVVCLGAQPVFANDTKTKPATEKLKVVWPDPTPEELALLPKDGCKELDDIQKPDEKKVTRAQYLAWTRTADGLCWDWYSRHFERAYVLGDTPPAGAAERPFSSYSDEELKDKPWIRPPVEFAPAGSHPSPRPGRE